MKKVCLVSLGCPKNLVDSEEMLGALAGDGWSLTAKAGKADLVILNTCGFLARAVEEAEAEIRRLAAEKSPGVPLLVAGCYAQRAGGALRQRPEISGLLGTGDPGLVRRAVREMLAGRRPYLVGNRPFSSPGTGQRLILSSPHAYLKVTEGCSNRCRYCLIPRLRGPLRSRRVEELCAEAECLAALGVKELVIVGQDTTAYGADRKDGTSLAGLVQRLARLPFCWIRILYAHPARITERLLSVIAKTPTVCRYLDLPVQHSHPRILAAMGRPVQDPLRLFDRIRKVVSGIAIRTTVMVGFPGEKEEEFSHLRSFVERAEVDRLGIFAFSAEQGTPAAKMPEQVGADVCRKRLREIAAVQEEISRKKLRRRVGDRYEVLVERREGDVLVGRTQYDAPEIDGVVRIQTRKQISCGTIVPVVITGSDAHNLTGVLAEDRPSRRDAIKSSGSA